MKLEGRRDAERSFSEVEDTSEKSRPKRPRHEDRTRPLR